MKQVEVKKAFGYGWTSVKKDFWYLVFISFIYLGVGMLPNISNNENINTIYSLIGTIISIFIIAGVLKISLEYYKGNKLPLSDLFSQGKYFWRLLGASIIIGIIVILGIILLIVPGIYWALKYQFVPTLIVDKDISISEAMKRSGEITTGIKLRLLWFDFICLLVIILGALALGVGVLVAYPVVWLAQINIYKNLQKAATEKDIK